MCPASSVLLAPNAAGCSPQKTHRLPQLASTCCANTCWPTRTAASRIPLSRAVTGHFGRCHVQPASGDSPPAPTDQARLGPARSVRRRAPGSETPAGVRARCLWHVSRAAAIGRSRRSGPCHPQLRAGQDVPAGAVRPRTIQVGHRARRPWHLQIRPSRRARRGWRSSRSPTSLLGMGGETGEPVLVDVCEAQLCARVRTFLGDDHLHSSRPSHGVQQTRHAAAHAPGRTSPPTWQADSRIRSG